MGIYIPGPTKGKAQFLIDEHDARPIDKLDALGLARSPNDDYVAVCVVDNGGFEAAAVIYNAHEFHRMHDWPDDTRPKRHLSMPREEAEHLIGYPIPD